MSQPSLATRSLTEARERGRAMRRHMPRSGQARLTIDGRDPVAILERQHADRLAELVPVRVGRMLQSPFAFFRGTAALMAHDLSHNARCGTHVVACGDAHIANFGLFASPERRVLFDLNDFDEASIAPWEWDVKRLAASVIVGGRDNSLTEDQCREAALTAVRGYRLALHQLHTLSVLERYYFRVETEWLEQVATSSAQKMIRKSVKKARGRTSEQVLRKLAVTDVEGTLRIQDQPPVTQHVDHAAGADVITLFESYRTTLRADTSLLVSQFTFHDYVLRVVGVGSVGTRCYVLLLVGPSGEPLFLQAKEAPPSVLETYGGIPWQPPAGFAPAGTGREGHRVVGTQRILQAQSDPFLGWITGYAGDRADRPPVDYYWRQFRDMKGSVELGGLKPNAYRAYASLCGQVLARAHSQSPGGAVASGYLGRSDRFEEAVATWATAYADQAERDFGALEKAARTGRLPAEQGV